MTKTVRRFKAITWTAIVSFGVLCYPGISTRANASLMTYDIGTTTAVFPGGTDTLKGTFTLDTSDYTSFSVSGDFNVTITGPVAPGDYIFTYAASSGPPAEIGGLDTGADVVELFLSNDLGNAPDPIYQVSLISGSNPQIFSTSASGFATPTTPLPATLPLFASGLGALGLLGWRRKRKARVSLLGAA